MAHTGADSFDYFEGTVDFDDPHAGADVFDDELLMDTEQHLNESEDRQEQIWWMKIRFHTGLLRADGIVAENKCRPRITRELW